MRATPTPPRGPETSFPLSDGLSSAVAPVVRQDLLELMGERRVSVVERLRGVPSRNRVGRSTRIGSARTQDDDVRIFSGSLIDVVLNVRASSDSSVDVCGVVLASQRVDLAGADRGYFDECIANLWAQTSRSQTLSPLGEFAFTGVEVGPAEIALSFGGHLMLAELNIG